MSDLTTLCSAMTVRSMILVCRALLSSSVLWRTLRWELMADMILHKKTNKILQKIIQKNMLVKSGYLGRITAVQRTFAKIRTENITI
jgi:hypothetical protein